MPYWVITAWKASFTSCTSSSLPGGSGCVQQSAVKSSGGLTSTFSASEGLISSIPLTGLTYWT